MRPFFGCKTEFSAQKNADKHSERRESPLSQTLSTTSPFIFLTENLNFVCIFFAITFCFHTFASIKEYFNNNLLLKRCLWI